MTSHGYLTVARDAEAVLEVSRSRFLCRVVRVGDEAAAREVVDAARAAYPDARHHCSAFVLGPDGRTARSSDDGEPAGTAGAPMLEVLRGHDLSDVVAVVTRWFGGVLLGAGGLVRAYGDAVRAALAEAGTVRRVPLVVHELDLDHPTAARLESELRSRGVRVLGTDWGERVRLRVAVGDPDRLLVDVAALTAGAVVPREVGTAWADVPQDTPPSR